MNDFSSIGETIEKLLITLNNAISDDKTSKASAELARKYIEAIEQFSVETDHAKLEEVNDYEQRWEKYIWNLLDVTLVRDFHDLGRVIETLATNLLELQSSGREMNYRDKHDFVLFGERGIRHSIIYHSIVRTLKIYLIIKNCNLETQSVIELASGRGQLLAQVWLSGGPPNARYYGLEITNTGRLFAKFLGVIEPRFRIIPQYFDFRDPALSGIPDGQNHITVFSNGGIEQITEVSKQLFIEILDKSSHVNGMHIEQVGWQIPRQALEQEMHANIQLADAGRAWAERHNLNKNLFAVLKDLENEGAIRMNDVFVNIFGKVKCPVTYFSWSKISTKA